MTEEAGTDAGPTLWAVAGCLFEVGLPGGAGGWEWIDDTTSVTLLDERAGPEPASCRLRFRAEEPATVDLRFRPRLPTGDAATRERRLTVHIAPETP